MWTVCSKIFILHQSIKSHISCFIYNIYNQKRTLDSIKIDCFVYYYLLLFIILFCLETIFLFLIFKSVCEGISIEISLLVLLDTILISILWSCSIELINLQCCFSSDCGTHIWPLFGAVCVNLSVIAFCYT